MVKGRAFEIKAKDEIFENEIKNQCCARAFLFAALKTSGTVEVNSKGFFVKISTPLEKLALYCARLITMLEGVRPEINTAKYTAGTKKGETLYVVCPSKSASRALITECGLMREQNGMFTQFIIGISKDVVAKECCVKSYAAGLLASAGSVYVPQDGAEGYHLEFSFTDENTVLDFIKLMEISGISFKKGERGAIHIAYSKDKGTMTSFLAFLNLPEATLELKKIIEEREIKNNINRNVICEAANLDKVYAASARQLVAISQIDKTVGLQSLKKPLYDVAMARLGNPRASMSELSEMLGVTKSCLEHRFRRLEQIAEEKGAIK